MKLAHLFTAALVAMLAGCATTPAGSVGAVFRTTSGQQLTAATAPAFKNGRYEFVDAAGTKQSLYVSQVSSVSLR